MHPILITTSGTGSRLGSLTKYNNKSLVPIGDKYAICHIIDNYPDNSEFIITLGHYGDNVKNFLELAYPLKHFKFVYVDKYDGPGSSLGYSMLKAKEHLQRSFIFHCCDTIVNTYKIVESSTNVLYVIKSDDYNTYSSINIDNNNNNNKVIRINEKGCIDNDYIYTGLCYIHNYQTFWEMLEKKYLENPLFNTLSDIHAISKMIEANIEFSYSVLDCYFDTGNINSYHTTLQTFKSNFNILIKPTENICFLNNCVIKYVNDKELNRKRYIRGNNLYPYSPKIIDVRDNFIMMEFIEGQLLSECKKYGEIYNILEYAQQKLWCHTDINDKYYINCINFYKNKTYDRIKNIPFLDNEIITINGINTGNIYDILSSVDFNFLSTNIFSKFHGDFILDNIIKKDNNEYCLIDWRHEFDTELYYGDLYYDLAKLRHNIILNHSNILNNLYEIYTINDEINLDIKCNFILVKQLEEYNKFIIKYNYNLKKIEILTAIIWLNMAPLYEGKLREFLFYFGKFNLYLALQETRP